MQIHTERFGVVEIEPEDFIFFPNGLIGFEDCQHWILLADAHNDAVAWLQSINRPDVAMPIVSPRRFVPDYRLRVTRAELEPLQLGEVHAAHVVVIASRTNGSLTLNLKAPVVINLDRGLGRQVIANNDQPLQYALTEKSVPLRKSA